MKDVLLGVDRRTLRNALAIAAACALAVSAVVGVVRENMSQGVTRIASAKERYVGYLTQSSISLQILLRQVVEANQRVERLQSSGSLHEEIDEIARENTRNAAQIYADAVRNVDEVRQLVATLDDDDSNKRGLSGRIETQQTTLDALEKQVSRLLAVRMDSSMRYREASDAGMMALRCDMEAISIGDEALAAADAWIERKGPYLRSLGTAVNTLVPLAAILGVFAAIAAAGKERESGG